MAELTCFKSRHELEAILRRYEGRVQNKFFKLTWRHWGDMASDYNAVVEKTWLLGSHGQVWWYEIYGDNSVSSLFTHHILLGDMMWFEEFLDRGFDEISLQSDIFSEGWEMVRYHPGGKIRKRVVGDIWGNGYLNELVLRVETYVMREVEIFSRKRW